jgi:hypothetical protein
MTDTDAPWDVHERMQQIIDTCSALIKMADDEEKRRANMRAATTSVKSKGQNHD